MQQAVIIDAVRTPIGRFQGGLSPVRPDDLSAFVMSAILKRTGVDGGDLDDVFWGCANQAGEDNRNVARMAALIAGIPYSVPAVTLNRLCASSLEAVNQARRMIQVGDASLCLAGGVESMSRAPYSLPRGPCMPKAGNITGWDTSLGWRYPNPKLEALFPLVGMGLTAENLVDQMDISRADQDRFALESHEKSLHAQDEGWFDKEIIPVTIKQRKGETVVARDEGPRRGTSMEKLAKLRPAFRKGGSVTAGNSSTLNDGASAVLVASEDLAKERGLPIRARIIACASAGVDPTIMGIGPVPATRKALAQAKLSIDDIEVWELNEAFSAQSLAVIRTLEIPPERINLHGGAISLGHPLGCTGARILTTLLNCMERVEARLGVASLCVGVGQGVTTIIERDC
ncbi:MAG: thiolase family protein [Proteobacteria bacterium]|jgi:3-oxoadipyl-CoA thiolase|nr:thiolase family protein [Pseudomonadota bacterium]